MLTVVALLGILTSSSAHAEDKVIIPLPVVGANIVLSDCAAEVRASPWNSRHAGEYLIDNARAQAICIEAKGDAAVVEAKVKAIADRAIAEDKLISAGAEAIKNGHSIDYSSKSNGDVHFVGGPAAEWSAYGDALASSNGVNGQIGGMGVGYVDPQYAALYRLNAGQYGFSAHPAVPGTVAPQQPVAPAAAPTTSVADGSALSACQAGLKVASKQLAECRSGQ